MIVLKILGLECCIVYIMGDYNWGKIWLILLELECISLNKMKLVLIFRKSSIVLECIGYVLVLVEKFMIVWGGYNVSWNFKWEME